MCVVCVCLSFALELLLMFLAVFPLCELLLFSSCSVGGGGLGRGAWPWGLGQGVLGPETLVGLRVSGEGGCLGLGWSWGGEECVLTSQTVLGLGCLVQFTQAVLGSSACGVCVCVWVRARVCATCTLYTLKECTR